jgi:putative restriction endonuclease
VPTVWSFMTLASRQYAGNAGYDDSADRYSFDSFVANSRRVRAGDLAVLRDDKSAFAIAKVERLDDQEGVKLQRRCPECRTTGIKARIRMSPRFRCNSGHTFETAVEEHAECKLYQARFGDSLRALPNPVPVATLKRAIVRYSEQHAISELNSAEMIGPEFLSLVEMLDRLKKE